MKYVDYTLSAEVADQVIQTTRGTFSGRGVRRSETGVSFGGSKADHQRFADFLSTLTRGAPKSELATDRQTSYLRSLLASENGELSGLRADAIDWRRLTKAEASRMINIIVNWA